MSTTIDRDDLVGEAPPTRRETPSFEPIGVTPRYQIPEASIDPDRSKGWIRRMAPVVLARKRAFITYLVIAAVALSVNVALPAVVGLGIDAIQDDRDLRPYVVAFAVLAVVRMLATFGYRFGLYRMSYAIEFDLRTMIYQHLSRMSFGFYDRVQTGQLVSRANSDIRSVQMLLAFAPFMSMMFLTFILAFAFMLTVDVVLTLIAVCTLPGVYFVGLRLRNVMFPISWIIQGRMADIATTVDENVTGVRVVKSFAAEERQIGLLATAAQKLRWIAVVMQDKRARYAPVMENLPRLGMAFVLLYGGVLVIDGQISVGKIVVFNSYVLLLQAPFRMLGFFLMLSQRASASAQRIFEMLDEPPEIVDRPGAVDLVEPKGRIEFRDVSFAYGGTPEGSTLGVDGAATETEAAQRTNVLDGFDLVVEPGETVALVGRTGCGKTTVARLIERFYDVDTGQVLVDGHDIRDLTLLSLRHHLGFVGDEPFLFSVSIRDNIAYGRPDADLDDIVASAKAAAAHDFIMELPEGYDTVVGERGYTLSGGQRQRLAIARTLLVNPKMLILDDATSAIDVGIETQIHHALAELRSDRTTILVAHRLSTISQADRVMLIEDGRVVASGTHVELMQTEPRYVEVLSAIEDEVEADAAAVETADDLAAEVEAEFEQEGQR